MNCRGKFTSFIINLLASFPPPFPSFLGILLFSPLPPKKSLDRHLERGSGALPPRWRWRYLPLGVALRYLGQRRRARAVFVLMGRTKGAVDKAPRRRSAEPPSKKAVKKAAQVAAAQRARTAMIQHRFSRCNVVEQAPAARRHTALAAQLRMMCRQLDQTAACAMAAQKSVTTPARSLRTSLTTRAFAQKPTTGAR